MAEQEDNIVNALIRDLVMEDITDNSDIDAEFVLERTSPKRPNVSAPTHYATSTIQPISFMEASLSHDEFVGYLKGNIVKYVSRYRMKDGVKDLEKARVYLDWLIEKERGKKITVMSAMFNGGER